jgi:hypothetical protein
LDPIRQVTTTERQEILSTSSEHSFFTGVPDQLTQLLGDGAVVPRPDQVRGLGVIHASKHPQRTRWKQPAVLFTEETHTKQQRFSRAKRSRRVLTEREGVLVGIASVHDRVSRSVHEACDLDGGTDLVVGRLECPALGHGAMFSGIPVAR